MRLVPRSLAGQLTLLLLLTLVVAQGVAVALFAWERVEAVRHAHRDNVITRTASVAQLLTDTPAALHGTVVTAASTRRTQFSLTGEPLVRTASAGGPAAAIARELAAALGVDRGQVRVGPVWARFDDDGDHDHHDDHLDDDDDDRFHGHDHADRHASWRLRWFAASVALSDGRWLNIAVAPPPGAPWGVTFLMSFILSALGTAGVAVVMGRRIARPMRHLAVAASQLGRGEDVESLREAGPSDVRATIRAFNLMRERLDRYVRDRMAMLAAVSHDLRTPITSLRLHAELVDDAETRRKMIGALDEMQRMTEEMLAFVRADLRRERTERVDLLALVDSVVADLADLGHAVSAEASERIVVGARPTALRRALRNLLENAAIHGGSATARVVRVEGECVAVVIEDTGPGIPEGEQERVFEPFVRLEESRSRDTGGTGLGLAIARSIVRAHGGDIQLENIVDGGLRVTVVLPEADGG
ncbi:MAG: ATP-binding protein [Rhodospirillales bacterium]|nr:ATP-binding protein [Rhodospirillales bacterium]MDE0712734.1 ATP-binding protein [Rhodospirillales bacterium]